MLRTWYRKRIRHEDRVKEGRESKPPPMPPQEDVFSRWVLTKDVKKISDNCFYCRQQFLKFANLYLKVGFVLGGFQELNSINFELVREEMFGSKEAGEGAAQDEGMDEVYEDEEIELSEDEDEVAEASAGEKKVSRLGRAWKWFLSLFDINRYKLDAAQ